VTNTYQAVSIPDSYLKIPLDMLKDELYGAFELELKNYLLYYGSIEPKKNIARIIEAYLASNLEMPLVIVGAQAWKADQELRLLKTLAARKDDGSKNSPRLKIIQLDYVTFPQLINLIRGALAVTFPSLYEGFGLPILEGMMCGTPVITSNMGSMREIAGEAALLVDPYDTRDIKDAMIAIANDASLRQTLVDRGIFVSRYFSLENYQDRIEHAYRRVAQA